MDLSIFTTPEAWISLVTLTFLEIVLGVDNIVFISITTDRLPVEKQHIGRKLGLAGALVMRCLFLCFASWLVHLQASLFTIDLGALHHEFSVRDLVMLIGGGYLVYKGISELAGMMRLDEVKAELHEEHKARHMLGLPQAVGTIMVMDLVFSIDSVITAVGLAEHLIVMILAVIIAVVIMMVFIDPISEFINRNVEMKILALVFIAVVGLLLVFDSLGITTGIEILDMHLEKFMVYFAMVFAVVLELIQMKYNGNLRRYLDEQGLLYRDGELVKVEDYCHGRPDGVREAEASQGQGTSGAGDGTAGNAADATRTADAADAANAADGDASATVDADGK